MASANVFLYQATIMASEQPQDDEERGGIIGKKNRIRIVNLGKIINCDVQDFAPTVSADGKTLFYCSNRKGSKWDPRYGEPSIDFWAAKKNDRLDTIFFTPYNIDTTTDLGDYGVNTTMHEGAASIAADKQSLYFTACDRPAGLGGCDIYKTTIEGDRWGKPVNLGKNVNSEHFDSQPSIAPDQSRIYFVSNRPGPNSNGKAARENFDIWYSDWDADNEEWKPAQNLNGINTNEEDVSPFIAADGVTLFFASRGYPDKVGGLDFYVTRYDPETNKWDKPQNLGEPINTKEDEQFITLPASGDIIYFSSERTDLPGYQGQLDVFMAFVPTYFRTTIVKGTVIDECSQEFIPASITIRNPVTGNIIKDSVTVFKKEFELIVSNKDYGNPKDSVKQITLEITAENPKYGKTMKAQTVVKPKKTEKSEDTEKPFEELFVKLTMGQRPVLTPEIGEADYIHRTKAQKPELASFNGLVMEQVQTWDLYPLLNYVFFNAGSSEILPRYIMFDSPEETSVFTDTTIAGGTLDKYYHLMNIYGYRLTKNPKSKIEIVGCNDGTTPEEKRANLSKERATNVYNYFKNIWKIDESRMKLTFKDKPTVISNLKDSLGITENRRVEILCSDWEIMMPVFDKDPKTFPQPDKMNWLMKNGIEDLLVTKRRIEITRGENMWKVLSDIGLTDPKFTWDWTNEQGKYPKDEVPYEAKLIITTSSGAECTSDPVTIPVMQISTVTKQVDRSADSTLERYSLILFPFDRSDAGPINERIMNDYVYDRVKPSSVVEVVGHTDVVGLYEHNQKLSDRRSNTVQTGIDKKTKSKYSRLAKRGVGEDEPLYSNELPEGRFYNRTVQVIIRTPVEDADK
ncbi:MAG: OmpA-like protein [Bacteroidota bacterium]|nr:OmpA-like protein [Bacteroidota bacterium]